MCRSNIKCCTVRSEVASSTISSGTGHMMGKSRWFLQSIQNFIWYSWSKLMASLSKTIRYDFHTNKLFLRANYKIFWTSQLHQASLESRFEEIYPNLKCFSLIMSTYLVKKKKRQLCSRKITETHTGSESVMLYFNKYGYFSSKPASSARRLELG